MKKELSAMTFNLSGEGPSGNLKKKASACASACFGLRLLSNQAANCISQSGGLAKKIKAWRQMKILHPHEVIRPRYPSTQKIKVLIIHSRQ
jgi:hypothetical protein